MFTLALTKIDLLNLAYLAAAVLFIFGLKMLGKVPTAARGNRVSAAGMLLATVATFFYLTGTTAVSLLRIVPALVIGANDVTNPAARHDTASPLYGMPVLDVDEARTVFVIKRSLNPGV